MSALNDYEAHFMLWFDMIYWSQRSTRFGKLLQISTNDSIFWIYFSWKKPEIVHQHWARKHTIPRDRSFLSEELTSWICNDQPCECGVFENARISAAPPKRPGGKHCKNDFRSGARIRFYLHKLSARPRAGFYLNKCLRHRSISTRYFLLQFSIFDIWACPT